MTPVSRLLKSPAIACSDWQALRGTYRGLQHAGSGVEVPFSMLRELRIRF